MCLNIDQAPRARDRRMIRCGLAQFKTQKRAQRQRIRRTPRNPAFGIDALKVPNQQRTKVNSRRQPRTPDPGIETPAGGFGKGIKSALLQQPVQTLIEWMTNRRRQLRCFDPNRFLLRELSAKVRRARMGISLACCLAV